MKKLKVLLLGASGNIGSYFIEEYLINPEYNQHYELILGIHKRKPKNNSLKIRKFSLDNPLSLKRAMKNIDVIVHLAANPSPKATFNELVNPNIIGINNIFQIAIKSKVKRVVFASSVHTIKGYGVDKIVKHTDYPKPITIYGATKVFTEALAHNYAYNTKLSCIGLRIGAYTPDKDIGKMCFQRKDYHYVISQRDMNQLIHKSIIAPRKIKFAILSGTSKNKKRNMDLKQAKKLIGYKPLDDAYKICKKLN